MMHRKSLWAVFSFSLFLAITSAHGYGDQEQDRNHPSVRWYTAETQHFRFHYEKGLRGVAEQCASRAEAVWPELTAAFGREPPGKVDFLVFDEDYSNGWAIASLNTMSIWSADFGFNLRGSKAWIRDVVAHEFGHVVSIQTSSKWKPWIGELQLGWDDASDSKVKSGGWLLWSLNPYSMAMAEGTAQWISQQNGGDRWDSHRAMIERSAALTDSLLPWGRMGTFSGTGLDYERVYGQGYSLVRHIQRTRGSETVVKWWKELSKFRHQSAGAAWKAMTGQEPEKLWEEWRDSAKVRALAAVEGARPLVEGRKIFGDAFNTQHPRWWSDSVILFSSNRGSDFQVNSLWGCDFSRKDTADRFWTVAGNIRSRFSFDTAAKMIWFHSGRNDDDRGRPVLDIYSSELKPDEKGFLKAQKKDDQTRVTNSVHGLSPEVRGDSLAVVVRDRSGFVLKILPSDSNATKSSANPGVFPLPDSLGQRPTIGIDAAIWALDGKSLFVDWFDGTRRRVDRVSRDGRILARMGDSLREWRDPALSPDGKWLYLASDRTGIFNLYRQSTQGGPIEQLTSVVGGAFQPSVSPDGKRLAFASWGSDGYQLRVLDSIVPFTPRAASVPEPVVPPPQEEVWDLATREQPYSPIPNRGLLSPILYAQRTAPLFGAEGTDWKVLAGARYQILDPVRKNTLVFLGLLDLGHGFDYLGLDYPGLVNPRQEKMLVAGWENRSLWPTIFVEAGYQTIRGEDTLSKENQDGGSVRIVESTPWALHVNSQTLGMRYSLTRNQKIHGEVSHMGYDFDMYQDNFRYPAYSSLRPSLLWTYLDQEPSGDERMADARGSFAKVQLSADVSQLQRSGSFQEVFQQEANGRITVKTVPTTVWRAALDVRKAFANPLWPDQTFEADAAVDGILSWSSDADTLNDFYLGGLEIPGYAAYKKGSKEARMFTGTRSAYFQLATRFPLLEIRKSAWIWYLDAWSAGAALHAGRAWRGDWYDADRSIAEQIEDFSRSVTWETRLSGRIHSGYPFHLSLGFSRALDKVDGIRQDLARFDVFGTKLATFAHRVEFGLNLGLDEWAIIDQSYARKPALPAPRRIF
jgi:hypothetical protein